MNKLVFILLLAFAGNLTAQDSAGIKSTASLYAGVNCSAMKNSRTYAGFSVGVQTLIKDTHLLAFELNQLMNTDFKFSGISGRENEVRSETNYEITYGRVLTCAKSKTKLILQTGLRAQFIKYQGKYLHSSANDPLFCEPYFENKSFWIPAVPVRLTAFRKYKSAGISFGVYANVSRYTDFGIRFAIHLME